MSESAASTIALWWYEVELPINDRADPCLRIDAQADPEPDAAAEVLHDVRRPHLAPVGTIPPRPRSCGLRGPCCRRRAAITVGGRPPSGRRGKELSES